jgi:glycolate oxidase iron-sulfur subunit
VGVDVSAREPVGAWDEQRPPQPELLESCVHCGFCLPTCPSYLVFENEADSPRGRILMIGAAHEEGAEVTPELTTHLDRCLGCMACVTACPSGVQYDRLIERARPQLERQTQRGPRTRALRAIVFSLFTHPGRLRLLVPLMALERRLGLRRLVPRRLAPLLALAPTVPAAAALHRLPAFTAARGERRGSVAFMQGCVQRAFFGDVNAATVRVLAAEGFDVHAPRRPRCCGALEGHAGLEPGARGLARQTIAAFERFDHVVVNVAGCGSAMKEYGHLLDDDPAWAERAASFSARVRDVTEFLAERSPRAPRHPLELRVVYHDACHLAHAQGVRDQPRQLLRSVPGLELTEPAGWELCCGSAGLYNLMEPEAAGELGARKAAALEATGAEAIVAANPGCAMQIAAHLERPLPIYHPTTILDHAIQGEPL